MQYPEGVTEEKFLEATEKAVAILARSFVFGYYQVCDIKQEGRVLAIEAMESYDTKRPLDNFIYTHIRNRLINLRRNKFKRNDPPCQDCHNSVQGETKHEDKNYCKRYIAWLKRNCAKQSIMMPLDITNISDENEPNTRSVHAVPDDIATKELLEIIDRELPVEYREVYLKMKGGEKVPRPLRLEVEKIVTNILKEHGLCLED